MRKVFLSTSLISKMDPEKPTKYISDDFELNSKNYQFPLSYLIDENVEEGDKVAIITAVTQTETPMQNYETYKQEVLKIVENKNIDIEFIEIKQAIEFDALTFNQFFKEVANLIQDNDIIFTDITFGMKCYSISMFIALAYVTKAGVNVNMDTIIYAQKYSGNREEGITSKIYDLTGLFSLNTLAGNARTGQKKDLDELLDFIID